MGEKLTGALCRTHYPVRSAVLITYGRFHLDGRDLGVNIGEVAGQTVGHAHVQLIPRYLEDVENPRGGARGVMPAKRP